MRAESPDEMTSTIVQLSLQERTEAAIGSLLLFAGAGLLFLVIVQAVGGLPWPMPGIWYRNQSYWGFVAAAMMGLGGYLLRPRAVGDDWEWQPKRPGVRFQRLVVYTKYDCSLCDIAKEQLALYDEYLPVMEEIEIDDSPELQERFGDCVPVVEFDGRIRFRGRINEILLRRMIDATAPRETPDV